MSETISVPIPTSAIDAAVASRIAELTRERDEARRERDEARAIRDSWFREHEDMRHERDEARAELARYVAAIDAAIKHASKVLP